MRRRPRLIAVLLALLLLGGPAALVQVAAWGAMLVERVPAQGLPAALATTFGGAAPCRMCLAARELRAAAADARQPGAPDPVTVKKQIGDLALPPPPAAMPAAASAAHQVPCPEPVPGVGEWPSPEPPPPRAAAPV